MRTSVTGVFPVADGALRASERLRELDHVAGAIRLFMAGPSGEPIESAVVAEPSPWPRMLSWSIALALLCAWIFASVGDRALYAAVGLGTGAVGGLLLGLWLAGETYARRLHPHLRARYHQLVRAGRAVLVAEVLAPDRIERVRRVMEEEGAYVAIGYWPVGAG